MNNTQYNIKSFLWSSHIVIAKLLADKNIDSILDVGSDKGFLGNSLSYKPKELYAIDKNNFSLPPIYSFFYEEDLDNTDFSFLGNKTFQVIVLADVIEHLKYPDVVVANLVRHLAKDGFFIFSLPNMGFFLVRMLSFLGVRPKMEKGLYDKTHLHDFDYKKACQFIENSGLEVVEFKVTPVPLPILSNLFKEGSPLFFIYRMMNFMAQKFPKLFAYQFIFSAKIYEI